MANDTVGGCWDRDAGDEIRFDAWLAAVRDRAADPGARLATYAAARRRRRRDHVLAGLSAEVLSRARAMAVPTDVPPAGPQAWQPPGEPETARATDVLRAAHRRDEARAALCRTLLDQPLDPDLREGFTMLLEIEERDMTMLRETMALNHPDLQ